MAILFQHTLSRSCLPTSQVEHRTHKTIEPSSPANISEPAPDSYVRHPGLAYMKYLLPLFVGILCSFTFALYIHFRGNVPAPRYLSNLIASNPRLTAQIVTICSSFLTAATRWSLSGAATLLAWKRILNRSRPILEIEVFCSLTNISVVWDWRHRKGAMFLTWLLVAFCGLLTSGFVTLLNPLPISIVTQLSGVKEVDLASKSSRCTEWFASTRDKLRASCASDLSYQGFGYSSCSADEVDIIDVTKFSMQKMDLHDQKDQASRLVSVYAGLNNTRVLGSTAGTLITGPDGIQAFDYPKIPSTMENYNYTLGLQGLWSDVSCSYDKTSVLNVGWGSIQNKSEVEYQINCPGFPPYESGNKTLSNGTYVAFEAVGACPMENGDNAILFRYFWNTTSSVDLASDYLSCRFPTRLGNVDTVLDADLRAFMPLRTPLPLSVPTALTKMAADKIVRMVLFHFNDLPTKEKLWNERFLTHGRKDGVYDVNVIASAMRGMFEYEATRLRLMLMAMSRSNETLAIPEQCLREVNAVVLQQAVGWNIQKSTIVGLIPLLTVAFITFTMAVLAAIAAGRLTLFDPTSPVSLISATSLGNVVFPRGNNGATYVCNPLDEAILRTRVSYGKHAGGWGLKSV